MKNLKFGMIALMVFTTSMINAQELKQKYNVDDSKIALAGYSSVSYLDLNLAQRGDKDFMSEYDGVKYFFTNGDQKKKFDNESERYVPQYGGFCATGIAVGAKFNTDPNKFIIQNDKLYVFLNSVEVDAKQLWNENGVKEMAKKADKNWTSLKNKY